MQSEAKKFDIYERSRAAILPRKILFDKYVFYAAFNSAEFV